MSAHLCPDCKESMQVDFDWIGRCFVRCPHCDLGRAHSRPEWYAGLQLRRQAEEASMHEPVDRRAVPGNSCLRCAAPSVRRYCPACRVVVDREQNTAGVARRRARDWQPLTKVTP